MDDDREAFEFAYALYLARELDRDLGNFITQTAEVGDFIFVPPFVPHREINASLDEPLQCALVRNDQEPVVVHLEIDVVEESEEVVWVDPRHPVK